MHGDVTCPVLQPRCLKLPLTLHVQVTVAFAPARNEELLQHRGFVETDNLHDFYLANILEFVKQTAIDQPNEEQLQEVLRRPALLKALTEVTQQSSSCMSERVRHTPPSNRHASLSS